MIHLNFRFDRTFNLYFLFININIANVFMFLPADKSLGGMIIVFISSINRIKFAYFFDVTLFKIV